MFHIGDTIEGKITGIQPYGAFVALEQGNSGLIHISEISDGYVKDISHFVRIGDIVKVKVIDFDHNTKQARLSLKALHKQRAKSSRHLIERKASLPEMKIGFSSIANQLNQWIESYEKEYLHHDEI